MKSRRVAVGACVFVGRLAHIAGRVVGVVAGAVLAALIFAAGYTFNSLQHLNPAQTFTAEAAPMSRCGDITARIAFDPRAGEALLVERDALRRKLAAAEARASTLEKELKNARSSDRSCGFSPDTMRMLDDARRFDG